MTSMAGLVAAICALTIAVIQLVVAPGIERWADAVWRSRGPGDPTVLVDLLDAARLLVAPVGFAAAAIWSWGRLRATTRDAALVMPPHRVQALAGAAVAVLAYGMLTSTWMRWADPMTQASDAGSVIQTRPDIPTELSLSDDGTAFHGVAGEPVAEPARAHPLITLTETSGSGLLLAVTLLVACVLAPVAEELLFRSVLFSSIGRALGWVPAAVVSTMLFTLVHVPIVRPAALVPIAGLGVVMCLLTWRNGSVAPAIAAHVAINAITMSQAVSVNQMVPPQVGVALVPASLAGAVMLTVWAGARLERRHALARSSNALA